MIVSIGKEFASQYKDVIEKLDSTFREIKSHTQVGYVEIPDFFNTKNEKVSIDCMKVTLQKMKREVFPVTSLVFATKFAHSAIKSICSIDTVLFYN